MTMRGLNRYVEAWHAGGQESSSFGPGPPFPPRQAAAAWSRVLDALEQAQGPRAEVRRCILAIAGAPQVIPGSELAAIVANDMLSQTLTDYAGS